MRRSTSQEVVGGDKPFKRGGVRATAGPRLGGGSHANNSRSKPAKSDSFLSPFKDWTSEQVNENTECKFEIISTMSFTDTWTKL